MNNFTMHWNNRQGHQGTIFGDADSIFEAYYAIKKMSGEEPHEYKWRLIDNTGHEVEPNSFLRWYDGPTISN